MSHRRRSVRMCSGRQAASFALLLVGCCLGPLTVGCGGLATDTLEDKSDPREACEASCDRQAMFCEDLDREGCSRVCDFVLSQLMDDQGCTDREIARWECDVTVAWECSPFTNELAQRRSPSDCTEVDNAFEEAGCLLQGN